MFGSCSEKLHVHVPCKHVCKKEICSKQYLPVQGKSSVCKQMFKTVEIKFVLHLYLQLFSADLPLEIWCQTSVGSF